jgi:hypothetical protein
MCLKFDESDVEVVDVNETMEGPPQRPGFIYTPKQPLSRIHPAFGINKFDLDWVFRGESADI